MEVTTIDQLLPEVLEEIFSHLSGSDLKNCALVCKAWNEVIGSSAVAMKKLKIGFRLERDRVYIGFGENRGIMHSSDKSCRQYQRAKISIRDGSLTLMPSLDRFDMSQVKSLSLEFKSSGMVELNKVMKLLTRMPLLRKLKIAGYDYFTIDTSNALAVDFTKLKRLNVEADYNQPIINIFGFIKADNIAELTFCSIPPAKHSDADIDDLFDFIWSKKSLAKLRVSENVFIHLHRRHDFSGMNLESLIVGFSRCVDKSVIENFRKSLISNAHSLTSLSIHSWLMSEEISLVIFNRLRKLTMLDIDGSYIYDDGSWMDNLSPNDISNSLSLLTLKLYRVGAMSGLKTILQRAPHLKKLTFRRSVTDGVMKEVAASVPRLVELEVYHLAENLTGYQRFNELKSLTIDHINNVGYFASLLERCPAIEVFECTPDRFEDPNNLITINVIDILLQHKTLKHLKFKHCWPAERRVIFDKLKTNYGNLRSLGLSLYDQFILIKFPDIPAEWNVVEEEAKFSDYQAANFTY